MRVRFLRRARRQLGEIYDYIALNDASAARAVITRVESVASLLSENPHLGRAVSPSGIRMFPVPPYPYVIYYRVRQDVEILRVRHAARRRLQFHENQREYKF
jgi:plasmid stabilization system protein ParE